MGPLFRDAGKPTDRSEHSHWAVSREVSIGSDISPPTVRRSMGLARLPAARDDQDVGRRQALEALQPNRSFDPDYEAPPECTNAARELLQGGFRYVLLGHMDMAKKIELQPGSGI